MKDANATEKPMTIHMGGAQEDFCGGAGDIRGKWELGKLIIRRVKLRGERKFFLTVKFYVYNVIKRLKQTMPTENVKIKNYRCARTLNNHV